MIALEILNLVEEKGEVRKWDLIKVLGNEAQFKKWIEDFLVADKVLVERREGRHYFYSKTSRGEVFHSFLRHGNIIKLYSRISGRRLKTS